MRISKSRSLPPGFSFVSSGCSLDLERYFWAGGLTVVIGIDEAGRGPLAGSVVAGAALLPPDFQHATLTDSKKLTERQREKIYLELQGRPDVLLAFAEASPSEIDEINILKATHLAMRRAAENLMGLLGRLEPAQMALIDGLAITGFPGPQTPVVKGDSLSLSIAAASIVAKVERDRQMEAADRDFPDYGFAKHKGYGTAEHLRALQRHGPCPLHRISFAPVAVVTQPKVQMEWNFES